MRAFPWFVERRPPPRPTRLRHRLWLFIERQLPNVSLLLLILALFAAVLYPHSVVTVPSGSVGVLWKRFGGGTVLDPAQLREEGLHLIFPWDELFIYDLRLQSVTDTYNAISKEGVSMTASVNFRFHLRHNYIPQLHQAVGPDYLRLMVRPEIGSRTREVIAKYTAEQVYSTARQEIQDQIRQLTVEKLGQTLGERKHRGIEYSLALNQTLRLYDTLILGIELPPSVVTAINRKTEQYYIAEEYTFRVDRERLESQRKQIEAVGIRDFQQTVSQGISDSYLRWRGIEATLQLAQSNNSKVVVIGGGKDGLPIILGNVDSAPSPVAAASGAEESRTAPKPPAAGPAAAAEKKPASALTTPSEATPAARPSTSLEAAPAPRSTTPSDGTAAARPASSGEGTPTSGATPSGGSPASGSDASSKESKADQKPPWELTLSDVRSILYQILTTARTSVAPSSETSATSTSGASTTSTSGASTGSSKPSAGGTDATPAH